MRRVALLLALSAACTVRNPAYCTTNDDCLSGQICDLGGASGLSHACVNADAGPPDAPLPPDAPPTDAPIPCPDAGVCPAQFPICRAGACTACTASIECAVTTPVCSGSGQCDKCTVEPDCEPRNATPHCASTGACVACRDKRDCTGTAPVCDATVCRACRIDAECNEFCDTDTGACVPDGNVLYVTPGGNGQSCAKEAPCGLIGTAVAHATGTTAWWIHIDPGTYSESLTLAGIDAHLVGPGALVVPGGNASGAVVSGTSAVTLRGLAFHDSTSNGVLCNGSSPATTQLRLTAVSLKGNAGVGLRTSQCSVVVERTTVSGNGHQGLLISDSRFDIEDSVIAGNSDGVVLTNPAAGGNRLDFNTVANNINSGVSCSGPSPTLTFDSNIVYGNGSGVQVSGGICTWIYSDIGPTGIGGETNINMNPMFTDSSFHIAPGSPCVNVGDPAAPPGVDIDGDPRPAGVRADIGADEAN